MPKKEKISNEVGDIAFQSEGIEPLFDPVDSLKEFMCRVNKDIV